MRVSSLLIAACGLSTTAAFAPPPTQFQVKNPTCIRLAVDPSIISDPTVLAAGAGTFIAIAFASFRNGFGETASTNSGTIAKSSKVDLSIPYDAAAKLAYNAYAESSKKNVNFKKFRELYEAQMVAEVRSKVMVEKVNEKKSEMQALEEQLSVMKAELTELENDVVSINDEAANYKNEVQALFSA